MFQLFIDYCGMVTCWTATLIQLRTVLKNPGNQRVLRTWHMLIFLSLFTTFQVDAVYSAVDRTFGVNNLSWLLSYVFVLPAIYLLCALFFDNPPRWTRYFMIVTLVLLFMIFPYGPARAPETLDHVKPANTGESLFVGLVYLYSATMLAAVPVRTCARNFKRQRGHQRVRSATILLAMIITIVNLIVKITLFIFFSSLPAAVTDVIHRPWTAALAILWPLGLMPNEVYRHALRPIGFLGKIWTCRELEYLRTRLDSLFPPVIPASSSWVDWLRNPDLVIYRATISILDRKKMLAKRLDGQAATNALSILHQGLQSIPQAATVDQVAQLCCKLNRQTRGL